MTSIPVFHFRRLGACSEGEELVTEADTEYRSISFFQCCTKALHGAGYHSRVTGTVGDEETIEWLLFW